MDYRCVRKESKEESSKAGEDVKIRGRKKI
jgi:hypothetical protein